MKETTEAPFGTEASITPALFRAILDDFPMGLMILDGANRLVWNNEEANLACAVWNGTKQGVDALPLSKTREAHVPPSVLDAVAHARRREASVDQIPPATVVTEPERNLYARIRLLPPTKSRAGRLCLVQLDYRRPRSDRSHPLSPEVISLLDRLSFREREVALRVREGLTNKEIAALLKRSPLTIKTQLAGIFQKLGVSNRARVTALLNR